MTFDDVMVFESELYLNQEPNAKEGRITNCHEE